MYVLRRFYLLAFFVLGALVAVGFASPFLTQGESAPARSRGAAAGIYFGSQRQADKSLARFDRDNPQCRLWTNWQKTCSRTGEGGAPFCVADRGRRARPTEPFCVATPFAGRPGRLTETQRLSSLRFCARTRREHVSDAAGNFLYEETICDRYRVDRPFNGRQLAARRHPLCLIWSRGPGGILTCVRWARRDCLPVDGVPGPQSPGSDDEIIIPSRFDPEAFAAFGVSCLRE